MADYIDKCECYIYSLNGGLAEATLLRRVGDNQYIAKYGDVECTAIFNPFVGLYYVDDKYGVIDKGRHQRGHER